MRKLFLLFIVILALSSPISVVAGEGEEGRYQAIPLTTEPGTGSAAFIIDTKEGHLWMWVFGMRPDKHELSTILIYNGQVRPGKKPGECIHRGLVE
ncbi:MAG: hypothetical protein ACFFCW_40095 [Candidatus Hodarchaeota archaeon]